MYFVLWFFSSLRSLLFSYMYFVMVSVMCLASGFGLPLFLIVSYFIVTRMLGRFAFSSGIKLLGYEEHRSPLFSAKVMNASCFTPFSLTYPSLDV
jgi:hypothetical protein